MIARLSALCPSHKKLEHFANAVANAGARGSAIALPGLRIGELKIQTFKHKFTLEKVFAKHHGPNHILALKGNDL